MSYFGARYYDPELGSWTSKDAAGQFFNPYGYSTNPVTMVDPDGNYVIGAILGGLIMGYAQGAMSSGSLNPGDWKGQDWLSAGMGAISGAMMGSAIEDGIIMNRAWNGKSSWYEHQAFKSYLKSGAWDGFVANKAGPWKTMTNIGDGDYYNSDLLYFNGEKLRLIRADATLGGEWGAVSGAPGTTPADQASKSYGPIPEGGYSVDPKKIDKFNKFDPRDADWSGANARRGWGNYRVPIEGGTNTYGRGGFFIHGGAAPGSAGCIDLSINEASFFKVLKNYKTPLSLGVYY